ncbi:MAG: alpha/beta fold hydrolase [Desulfobacterales bacterium]|nr:alpha/beta fold hydrolase [Desulfobacterales bacterium]
MENMKELFALRGLTSRIATEEEISSAEAFYSDGSKTGVLFIHGFTVTPANFRAYGERIAKEYGFTVSIPLLPGHGTKPDDLIGVNWFDWLIYIIDEFDKLKQKCDTVFVVGISLGGALALHLSKQRKGIKKLYLLAPAVYASPLLEVAIYSVVPAMKLLKLPFWFHVAGDVKKTDGFEIGYNKTAVYGLEELYKCMKETERILPFVQNDVLLFQGKIDHEVPAEKADDILKLLGSPKKQLIWLDNSYHEIPRDEDSEVVYQAIVKDIFLMLNS